VNPKHPVPDEMLRDWFGPFTRDRQVRQDLRSYCHCEVAPAWPD